jgi:hypothetical protein
VDRLGDDPRRVTGNLTLPASVTFMDVVAANVPSARRRAMRRAVWTMVAATILALTIGGLASASQAPSSPVTQVINLLSRATAINDFVDIRPSGPSPGDLYAFSDRLFAMSDPED